MKTNEQRTPEERASALAQSLPPDGELRAARLLPALRRNMRAIRREKERAEAIGEPEGAELWLLDNAYLAIGAYQEAANALRAGGKLRCCRGEALLLQLCRALLAGAEDGADEALCRRYLEGFQAVRPLRRTELLLFPELLRLACLERIASPGEADQRERRVAAAFETLRMLSLLDLDRLLTAVDLTGAVLCADPGGVYAHMDAASRGAYLDRLARLARREGVEELDYARAIVCRAREERRHLGFLLFSEPGDGRQRVFIALNLVFTLALSLLLARACGAPQSLPLLLLPASELVKSALDLVLQQFTRPRRVFRMETGRGVPREGKTLCVLSCLLTDAEDARRMAARLEELSLVCRAEGEALCFGLLADLPESGAAVELADAAVLAAAEEEIARLNGSRGGGFFLFTRPRREQAGRWAGFDRKRGALLELAKLLAGEESELRVTGDATRLAGTRFLLTLDSDTRLLPGSAGALIGAMLHPLNRAQFDEGRRCVTAGYGILQPRLTAELRSAGETDFALVFSGGGGSDPYGALSGEREMDAFGSAGFSGKGLIDLRVFLRATRDLPCGRILSHDAVEGALLRCARVGQAEAADAFPARPLPFFRRLHRWTRGDWQNLPFLFRRGLPPLERWRFAEKLRRSLLAPATLAAILAGFFLPGRGLRLTALAALSALLAQLLIALGAESLRRGGRPRRMTRLLSGAGGAIVQSFFRLWLLPYEAWICLTAIASALWRLWVSGRNLLQWRTAAQSEGGDRSLAAHIRQMGQSVALGVLLMAFSPAILGKAAGLLWLLSPVTAFALALPAQKEKELSAPDRAWLRHAAAEAYGYFERCCTEEEHFLPPDHVQVQPPLGAAHRTSPTNIGLCLLSHAAAAELSLIDRGEAAARMEKLLTAIEALPRYFGHLPNWVDTRTLRPLPPLLLSTVDSGNLCAALLAAESALLNFGREDLARRAGRLAAEMDFAPLFDRRRGLFFISYDPTRREGCGGWYDLMASEAMLTSYLAVARGDVPASHWRRLGRGQLQKDGYRGLASWTGTMFEYLMPALFLPYERGSLLWESARFCLYAQQRQRMPGKPWGLSESAVYAFGADLEYVYKANGCAALALKRGQEADFVSAPYASFLALAVDAQAAVRNLRALERGGARGRFGFLEAMDYTPERCEKSEGERVDCFMAHHIGMSVLAAANALEQNAVQKLFFRNPAMRAFRLLLQERLPEDPPLLRRETSAPAERPARSQTAQSLRSEGETLLTNGVWSIRAEPGGATEARCGALTVYTSPGPAVMKSAARMQRGRDSVSMLRAEGSVQMHERIFAAAGETGEGRSYTLCAQEEGEYPFSLRLRPLLAAQRDVDAHPAYWELGISAEAIPGGLLLCRLRRGEKRACFLCLLCDREALWRYDPPLVQMSLLLPLRAGEEQTLRLALCFGWDRRSAEEGARRILREWRASELLPALASRLGLGAEEQDAALDLLPLLRRRPGGAAPRSELWRFGISGDYPLLCADAGDRNALPLLRRFLLLRLGGQEAELALFCEEEGAYRSPLRDRVRAELRRLGLEALLSARGGVHLVPASAAESLRSRAVFSPGEFRLLPPALALPVPGGARGGETIPAFRQEGERFVFRAGGRLPPRAWQLPLSNGSLGCIAADCGPAALWLRNARMLPLLPPMADARGVQGSEALTAQLRGRRVSLFAANDGRPCTVSFAPGCARWEKELGGRWTTAELFLCEDADARVLLLDGAEGLELLWQLQPQLAPEDASSLRGSFSEGLFCAENPECLQEGLVFRAGASVPCGQTEEYEPAALSLRMTAAETTVLVCGTCPEERLRALLDPAEARRQRDFACSAWKARCGRPRFASGSDAIDCYLNGWAVYQTLAGRLLGRSSLYQRGGAYGFRDQLQDAVNLLFLDPELAREQILRCCRHQYAEGDVMHWWHELPAGDRGLRSRCSDDLLWLPWALCEYMDGAGDENLLREETPWLASASLGDGERDRYEQAAFSGCAPVLRHARAALDCCLARGVGAHGLPRFGSGDWNDGLDAVDGESVWLGFFFSHVAARFAGLLESRGEDGELYRAAAERIGRAAERSFNGRFYRRGYWADGETLGGEERIDALPQAWAAFCPWADDVHVDAALEAAYARLVDEKHGLVRLLDPPYGADERYPGYLAGYGPGVRENGGQYSHGAIFLALALLRRGRRDRARRILELLLPAAHEPSHFQAEPFVLPADVCAAPGREGRAGWSWYTGSAGWYLRAAREMGWEEA